MRSQCGRTNQSKTKPGKSSTHFHEALLRLKQTRGPTMQQVGYHHANTLASNITSSFQTQLQEQNDQLTSLLSTMPSLTTTSIES